MLQTAPHPDRPHRARVSSVPWLRTRRALCQDRHRQSADFVIPNCFAWRGSLVVLDVKGEAFRATAGYRSSRCLARMSMCLTRPPMTADHTAGIPCNLSSGTASTGLTRSAGKRLCCFPSRLPAARPTPTHSGHHQPAARSRLLRPCLPRRPANHSTWRTVLRCFARGDSQDALAAMINQRRASGGPGYSQIAVDGVSDYLNGSADQVGGIRKMTSTRLQSWFNPRIRAATAASDFDLRDHPAPADDDLRPRPARQHRPHAPAAGAVLRCVDQPQH